MFKIWDLNLFMLCCFFDHPSVMTENRIFHSYCISAIAERSWEQACTHCLSLSFLGDKRLAKSFFINFPKADHYWSYSANNCLNCLLQTFSKYSIDVEWFPQIIEVTTLCLPDIKKTPKKSKLGFYIYRNGFSYSNETSLQFAIICLLSFLLTVHTCDLFNIHSIIPWTRQLL